MTFLWMSHICHNRCIHIFNEFTELRMNLLLSIILFLALFCINCNLPIIILSGDAI